MTSLIALIPAKATSVRVVGKNGRILREHPLMAYTIRAAIDSGVFERVIVSTNSEQYRQIAHVYGAEVCWRPDEYATDLSPDFDWVGYTMGIYSRYDAFAILRVTSPFRQAETIQRAWAEFQTKQPCDSLRAVELCRQHPAKMWRLYEYENRMEMQEYDRARGMERQPKHSVPYQALPPVYVQNASLEIAWTRVIKETGTISGNRIVPFLTEGYEGFDINREEDWILLEALLDRGLAKLPEVKNAVLA